MPQYIHLLCCLCNFSINSVDAFGSFSQEKYNYLFEKYLKMLLPLKWPQCVMPKNYLVLKRASGNDRFTDLSLPTLSVFQTG